MLTVIVSVLALMIIYGIIEYYLQRPSKNAVRAEIKIGKISNKHEDKEK